MSLSPHSTVSASGAQVVVLHPQIVVQASISHRAGLFSFQVQFHLDAMFLRQAATQFLLYVSLSLSMIMRKKEN